MKEHLLNSRSLSRHSGSSQLVPVAFHSINYQQPRAYHPHHMSATRFRDAIKTGICSQGRPRIWLIQNRDIC